MTFGPDYYHLNFADKPLPLAQILSDQRISFVILKYSQGTSYGDWAVTEGKKVRASRAALGGYHMLDGESAGGGAAQAEYYLGKFSPKPGDIVPIVDFEGSGQGSASLLNYKARLLDFIDTIHRHGFKCMLYGHSTVKAAFSDWRQSGADFWWVPGSSPHADIGARGPDLWQYAPYTFPTGFPQHPADNGSEDVSRIMTNLPLIAGTPPTPVPKPGPDPTPKPKPGDDMSDYSDGVADYLEHPNRPLPLPDKWPAEKVKGYKFSRQLVAKAVEEAKKP